MSLLTWNYLKGQNFKALEASIEVLAPDFFCHEDSISVAWYGSADKHPYSINVKFNGCSKFWTYTFLLEACYLDESFDFLLNVNPRFMDSKVRGLLKENEPKIFKCIFNHLFKELVACRGLTEDQVRTLIQFDADHPRCMEELIIRNRIDEKKVFENKLVEVLFHLNEVCG